MTSVSEPDPPFPGSLEYPQLPASEAPEHLGFTLRKRMVRWLSPKELGITAVRVLLSSAFGAYADKREIQAALDQDGPVHSYVEEDSPDQELWVDFVADLGDAFGPTYAIACLLARPELEVGVRGAPGHCTQRGRVLIMGGDQVYPTASIEDYNDRTLGPYRAALPFTTARSPHLYAIPGNHDWYDGLTSFMRVFCRRQWVGGWKTKQRRSYFALELPHRWWIWGIDIQFGSYIDEPQFRYFNEVVGPQVQAGDSVILCSAVPAWVKSQEDGHREAFSTLDYFEREVVRNRGAVVRLSLSGDAHHYARYEQVDGDAHRITAGGGGAFLSATHHLPDRLEVPPTASRALGKTIPPVTFTLKKAYPDKDASRKLRWQVRALPVKNWSMWGLIGAFHLLYAGMIQAVLRDEGQDFSALMPRLSVAELARGGLRNPLAVLLSLMIVWGMMGFTKSKKWWKRAIGVIHGVSHLALALGTIAIGSHLLRHLEHGYFLAAFIALVGVGGGLLGSWLLAGYLILADSVGCNTNELFAAQRGRHHKNFLRLHLSADGLTIYPVKLERTPSRWRLRPARGAQDAPWFEAVNEELRAELIEEPVYLVPPEGTAGSPSAVSAPPVRPGRRGPPWGRAR